MFDHAVLYDPDHGRWRWFARSVDHYEVHAADQVMPTLQRIEARCRQEDLHAAGFVAYEAAPAFDPALTTHEPDGFPLLCFGLFHAPEWIDLPPAGPQRISPDWRPGLDPQKFDEVVQRIRAAIAAGETYQVNFTFPLQAEFDADPWDFFRQLVHGQQAPGAGYLDAGRWAICSASPELFFARADGRLLMRPMKGTAPRGRTLAEDRRMAQDLRSSAKDRAENVMILDMVRNDLGRLAPPGSVRVTELYALEKYPTLWQMTSTAVAESAASLAETFRALFPCASITGAPKARTMQIIRALEDRPRRIYTGAFGWLAPDGAARFSVAIRTALIDRQQQSATYGVGAGITWDSQSAEEYRECLTKAEVLNRPQPEVALIETLRWTPRHGYFLLREHLARVRDSAEYFGFPLDAAALLEQLDQLARKLPQSSQRVRLLLHADGRLELSVSPLPHGNGSTPLRLGLADRPVDPREIFLYHKTTRRELYTQALNAHADCDDVVLWNHRGEVTETCNGNLVIVRGSRLVTPPLASGLLPGTYRAHLLARRIIHEEVVTLGDLADSPRIYRINAVRKWQKAILGAAAEEGLPARPF